MKYLLEFFHQKVPKAGTEMPAYYRNALSASETILTIYYALSLVLIYLTTHKIMIPPIVLMFLSFVCLRSSGEMRPRVHTAIFTAMTLFWCGWYIYLFGWSCGGQHLLLPLLLLAFFNIFDSPVKKISNWAGLIAFRMGLFFYTLHHDPVYVLDPTTSVIFQTVNSVTLFIIMAVNYIIFSTSIQDTERKLRIDNQELHKEAGTDPLTGLLNRRAMLDRIELFKKNSPDSLFSVAIADIDFFKKVNDTYGHNCGDYTLKELSKLFMAKAGDDYSVCRWGGEEFCFFLPEKNIDDAWVPMFDLCDSVRKMPLSFEGNDFSITVTIGIEENNFRSPVNEILDKADKKLYMGKVAGRNRVVM